MVVDVIQVVMVGIDCFSFYILQVYGLEYLYQKQSNIIFMVYFWRFIFIFMFKRFYFFFEEYISWGLNIYIYELVQDSVYFNYN